MYMYMYIYIHIYIHACIDVMLTCVGRMADRARRGNRGATKPPGAAGTGAVKWHRAADGVRAYGAVNLESCTLSLSPAPQTRSLALDRHPNALSLHPQPKTSLPNPTPQTLKLQILDERHRAADGLRAYGAVLPQPQSKF